MTLEQFAKKCGVTLIECDAKGWGGSIGYKSADHPNCCVVGFRTNSAAYKHWMVGTFGKQTSRIVMRLLKA